MKMEHKYYSNIIKMLKKVGPSLIITSKSVPMIVRKHLLAKNISLVCKTDLKLIKKISELTNSKIIDDIK